MGVITSGLTGAVSEDQYRHGPGEGRSRSKRRRCAGASPREPGEGKAGSTALLQAPEEIVWFQRASSFSSLTQESRFVSLNRRKGDRRWRCPVPFKFISKSSCKFAVPLAVVAMALAATGATAKAQTPTGAHAELKQLVDQNASNWKQVSKQIWGLCGTGLSRSQKFIAASGAVEGCGIPHRDRCCR